MKYVYLVMSGEDNGRVLGVFSDDVKATQQVWTNARAIWGINPLTEPLDFDGESMRYGWADKIWWQREVVY